MSERLDEPVTLTLRTDEAMVLYYLLSRELWTRGGQRIAGLVDHPAELHALHALLQELVHPLMWTGDPEKENEIAEISRAAYASLISRYGDLIDS